MHEFQNKHKQTAGPQHTPIDFQFDGGHGTDGACGLDGHHLLSVVTGAHPEKTTQCFLRRR
ncbi:MAG: hypothetical protein QM749_09460 [Aquabacterium sp.]